MKKSLDKKAAKKIRETRSRIASPLVKIVAKTGVKPNTLSYLGVISMLFFIGLIKTHPWASFGFLLLSIIIDGFLDGALARYLKIDSDKGKFVDVVCDVTVFALFIIGLTRIYLIKPTLAVLFVFIVLMVKLFAIIKKNLGEKTDWLIHPFAGTFVNFFVYVTYGLFPLWLITHQNYINNLVTIFASLLIAKALLDFRVIISKKF